MSDVADISKKQPRGKPFAKGVSGNPGGRPKRTKEEVDLIKACKEKTADALEVIQDLMEGSSNDRVRLAAAEYVLDRAWGKPTQRQEQEPIQIEVIPDDKTAAELWRERCRRPDGGWQRESRAEKGHNAFRRTPHPFSFWRGLDWLCSIVAA